VLKNKMIDPLDYFDHENKLGSIYRKIGERLFELLPKWGDFRRTRWNKYSNSSKKTQV
jgi:hypothetical protein